MLNFCQIFGVFLSPSMFRAFHLQLDNNNTVVVVTKLLCPLSHLWMAEVRVSL